MTLFFGLVDIISIDQAIHYLAFCFVAILGAIQFAAVRYRRTDLAWLAGRNGYALSAVLVIGSFGWFFVTDQEIFIPGLAGGEFFTLFVIALGLAVPVTRGIAFAVIHGRAPALAPRPAREKEPLV
jgi:hypothetical protein